MDTKWAKMKYIWFAAAIIFPQFLNEKE